MATIINSDYETRVFHDFHPNIESAEADYDYVPDRVESDSGGMHNEISSKFTNAIVSSKNAGKTGKCYQWNTKNKSFIEVHNDLKKLGIKNNKFFLVLYDRDLLDIDPYDTLVPLITQAKIIRECIRNPWYFLREICRIPEDGMPICPGGGIPFIADRNNIATWYCFLHGLDHYSSKPRQRGKTQDALAKCDYAYNFGAMSATITFSNKDLTLNKMNLSRLKIQRDLLPLYLQARLVVDVESGSITKETSNVTSMKNPLTKNQVVLLPTASTEGKAQGVGRGFTASIMFFDEFDWTPWNTEIINASVFAFNTASTNAKKNKSLYGRIFTSTPGNMDTKDGERANIFINGDPDTGKKGMLKWVDDYFDMPIEKLRSIVYSKSYNRIVYIEHSWKQLKCSNDWYDKACAGVSFDPEQIAREILLKRLRGSSKSPFKRNFIMSLISNVESPIETVDLSDNCSPIYFYEKLNRSYPYILSIDPAEGLSGDNMAMVLINPYTEKTSAEFASPHTNQTAMSKMVVRFLDRYCPKSVIVIENNRGRELINRLRETHYADHLWYDADRLDKKEAINQREASGDAERAIGWNTSTTTRPRIFGIIETLVTEEPEKLNSKLVVDDVCALEKNPRTGTIKAANGKHDDMILAAGIGHTVLRTATNLDEWGIIRGMPAPDTIDRSSPENKMKILSKLLDSMPLELKKNLFGDDTVENKTIVSPVRDINASDDIDAIFGSFNKDPLQEFESNNLEIRKAEAMYNLQQANNNAIEDVVDDQFDPYDTVIQDALDDELFNLNFYHGSGGNNQGFDIDNFI